MNLEKLSATAKREMRRSPKKTVLLGLMCLVALYYWVPIVKGIFGGSSDAEELANNGLIVPTTPATPTAAPAVQRARKTDWATLAKWIESDPRMQPAKLEIDHDPFRSQAALLAEQQAAVAMQLEAMEAIHPAKVNLKLQSTAVSPRRQTAVINNKTYELRGIVSVETRDHGLVEFQVVGIQPERVTLERNGKHFSLTIVQKALNPRDQISEY